MKISLKDINGSPVIIDPKHVEQYSHYIDKETGKSSTLIEINGERIFVDIHIMDFTSILFKTIHHK